MSRCAAMSQMCGGEEAADTLFDLITPAGHELATRSDVDQLRRETDRGFERLHERFDALEERLDHRFRASEEAPALRFVGLDARLFELGGRFERRIADAVTTQTRTGVLSQLAALVVIAGLASGLR